ncbi:hypothetical protein [Chryseobacterium sp. T1]
MKNIQLIIDRNYAGYDIIFNKELAQQLRNNEGVQDEREVAQISHRSFMYSLFNNSSFKIYSYINSNVVDKSGRNAFYAIRLVISQNSKILDVQDALGRINEKYLSFLETNNLHNQNYDDILNSVVIEEEKQLILVPQTEKAKFYHYMDGFSKINDLINSEGLKSFEKVYFFDQNTAVDSSNAETLGLKKATSSSVKIKVNNPDNYLEAIKVNDQEVNFNRKSEFSILCKNSDKITYKEVGDKKWKNLIGNQLEVRKPYVPEKPKRTIQTSSKSAPIGNYILIGALGLILGGAGGYFAPKLFSEKQELVTETQDTTYVSPATYNFKLAPDNKDVVLVADNISGLEDYKFKFKEAGQWFYCKSTENYKPLNKQDLKDLIKDASIDSLVISSLENFSGKSIPEKDVKAETTAENASKDASNPVVAASPAPKPAQSTSNTTAPIGKKEEIKKTPQTTKKVQEQEESKKSDGLGNPVSEVRKGVENKKQ